MSIEKFCTKCGKKFVAVGREVICPACKESAKEEAKKAAVLKAKQASWRGESVPVRISGRASTVIRTYSKANSVPFAQALDEILKASDYFKSMSVKWENVEPYKSRRLKKSTGGEQEAEQDKLEKPVEAPASTTKQAAKATVKGTVKKTSSKAASKVSKAVKKGEEKA